MVENVQQCSCKDHGESCKLCRITSSRHLLSDKLYSDILVTAKKLGYKVKGKNGWQKLLERLLDYCKLHPDVFKA